MSIWAVVMWNYYYHSVRSHHQHLLTITYICKHHYARDRSERERNQHMLISKIVMREFESKTFSNALSLSSTNTYTHTRFASLITWYCSLLIRFRESVTPPYDRTVDHIYPSISLVMKQKKGIVSPLFRRIFIVENETEIHLRYILFISFFASKKKNIFIPIHSFFLSY